MVGKEALIVWNSHGRTGENFDHLPKVRRDAFLAEI
jgi:hypothetical protein